MSFNSQSYEDLIKDLIGDAFYIDSRSNRGKITTIRQYAEVVIRKLLDLPDSEKVTLGDHKIINNLKTASQNNILLMTAVEKIRQMGNKCTHTQNPQPISDKDVDDVVDELFNLYASIFILYFEKYRFGSNNEIMSTFSILPPIIRYIVLDYLYTNDKQNLSIIDKLSLVLLKALDKDSALKWIEERKGELESLSTYTQEAIDRIELTYGKTYAENIVANAPENMYVLCLERINSVSSIIDKQGLLYTNFEQAKPLYLKEGILPECSKENIDFNGIMNFVYIGRKSAINEKLENQHLYNIIN